MYKVLGQALVDGAQALVLHPNCLLYQLLALQIPKPSELRLSFLPKSSGLPASERCLTIGGRHRKNLLKYPCSSQSFTPHPGHFLFREE